MVACLADNNFKRGRQQQKKSYGTETSAKSGTAAWGVGRSDAEHAVRNKPQRRNLEY